LFQLDFSEALLQGLELLSEQFTYFLREVVDAAPTYPG
jgi:hypothetical protein